MQTASLQFPYGNAVGFAFTGDKTYGYGWWIVSFQLFTTLFVMSAASTGRSMLGATALLAVLTTSTFLYTSDVVRAAAPRGGVPLLF